MSRVELLRLVPESNSLWATTDWPWSGLDFRTYISSQAVQGGLQLPVTSAPFASSFKHRLCTSQAAAFAQQCRSNLDSQSPFFVIPSVATQATVSVALCAAGLSPRFFISNSSTSDSPGSAGGPDVFEIPLDEGQGSWTGGFPNGGVLGVENVGQASFEVGFSDNANASAPTPPDTTKLNFTMFLSPTSTLPDIPKTGCALRTQTSAGRIDREVPWLKDDGGWRQQWFLTGLSPSTNYTAYVIQEGTRVSGPIMFATNRVSTDIFDSSQRLTCSPASFTCPLVASLPFCPGIAYSVPLPPPPAAESFYDASTIPDAVSAPLISGLANFTASLLTFACGKDYYSPLASCADCQREYRKWLCAISFPRCSEPNPGDPTSFTRVPASPGATGLGARPTLGGPQQVFSALLPQPTSATPRNPNFPSLGREWTMLLPCLETCYAVDRACPNFLGFRCPLRRFNAAATYGVGYVDTGDLDGKQGTGVTGASQDRWGNIWCNAG
ncbi:stretch-activated cation channel mid [Salix suchowensis]|nr:stretch-activated cation channel mid [Salix suchowensis]